MSKLSRVNFKMSRLLSYFYQFLSYFYQFLYEYKNLYCIHITGYTVR